jgi:Ca-activated chloride channel family protein
VIRRVTWFLISALLIAAPVAAQDTVIRVNVRLVRMLVTVKDANGQLIGSLNKNDFAVSDNGVNQEVALFERQTEQPLNISVLVDNSASTGIDWPYEKDSVSRFLRALLGEGNPRDTAALYSFNWEVRLLRSFTRNFASLDQKLKLLKSEGGTSLYDAITLASQDLELREGRHVMVIVTDGGDTTSVYNFHHALEAAQVADAMIYPVLVMPITNNAGRNIGGENALTTLAAGTGGRVFTPSLTAAELDLAFSNILRELRTQYLIGFYPRGVPPTKDRFHMLKVNVTGRNLRVSTRSGYYGDFSDSPKGLGR